MTEEKYYEVVGRMGAHMHMLKKKLDALEEELQFSLVVEDRILCMLDTRNWLYRGMDHLDNMLDYMRPIEEHVDAMTRLLDEAIGEDDE